MCLNLKPNNGLKIYEVDLGSEIELWAHLKTERRPQPAAIQNAFPRSIT